MTTTSIKMKGHTIVLFISVLFAACTKQDNLTPSQAQSNNPSLYSSEVIEKWMALQVRLMKNTTGIPNQAFSRPYVYAGIAALESIAPGMPANTQWTKKWNSLTGLPEAEKKVKYYWPANINAALASINKSFFPNANNADKAAIDSLENALSTSFKSAADQAALTASAQYGKAVATTVFNWAETDGYKNANASYSIPIGAGLWLPTAPSYANPVTPYWGNNRPTIVGSTINTQPSAPISFSTNVNSAFYAMVKEVYDASQHLTDDQKAMAIFWRDVPGVTSPGHWLSILLQTVQQTNASLDKAAIAYALTGAAINDGLISCWQTKYQFNLVRPITYIRNVMGYETWNPYLTTPGHPEYSSAHAVLSTAAADVFQRLFGNVGSFTDHTYDYLGFAPRTYSSFTAIGEEASYSRLYAGIHYIPSINAGIEQGKKVAANIFNISIDPSNSDLK